MVSVAQMVRVLDCDSSCCRFKSDRSPNNMTNKTELHELAILVRERTGLGIMQAKKLLITNNFDVDKVVKLVESTPLNKLFPGCTDMNPAWIDRH